MLLKKIFYLLMPNQKVKLIEIEKIAKTKIKKLILD